MARPRDKDWEARREVSFKILAHLKDKHINRKAVETELELPKNAFADTKRERSVLQWDTIHKIEDYFKMKFSLQTE